MENTSPSLFSDEEECDCTPTMTDKEKECDYSVTTSREKYCVDAVSASSPQQVQECPNAVQANDWSTEQDERQELGTSCFYFSSDLEQPEEEEEISYTSEQTLLEISSESDNLESLVECAQNIYSVGRFTPNKLQEKSSSTCLAMKEEIMKEIAGEIKKGSTTTIEKHVDGTSFRFQYSPPCSKMLEALHKLRYSAELIQWAFKYLNQKDPCTGQMERKPFQ
ncbi:hypothetical protein GDO86_001582 [Hymenochirus boettgeri]|nr:hypothetical protein GDO86_001582 [Hymenochirus boettgeri]